MFEKRGQFYSSVNKIGGDPSQKCDSQYPKEAVDKGGNTVENEFDYTYDVKYLRSLQEIPNTEYFVDKDNLLREGIPTKIINKLNSDFDLPTLKLSVPKFVFRCFTNLVDKVYKGFKNTNELRDVSFFQFSQFIKAFITICNTTFANKFLHYCINQDIIPPKFKKKHLYRTASPNKTDT